MAATFSKGITLTNDSHRALNNHASLTDEDVKKCSETLSIILQWLSIMEYVLEAACTPYRYFVYGQ